MRSEDKAKAMNMLQLIFVYVSLFIFFALLTTKWIIPSSTADKQLPPSPPKLPILGNLHQLGRYPHRSLQALAQRYGSLMLVHFGSVPVLIISSADAAREVMKTHDLIFSNRPKSRTGDRLLYGCKDLAATPYGEYWRQMRSIFVLQLLSTKRVQSFRTVREEEIDLLVEKIGSLASLSLPVNLSEMFSSLTNDVICRAAFGRKYSGDEGGVKFKELLREFSALFDLSIGDFIPWLRWVDIFNGRDAKMGEVAKQFDDFLDEVVEEHLHGQKRGSDDYSGSEDGKDLVDVLLEIQKDNMAGFAFDRVCIKALILDIFAGGTDTTYAVLEWAMTQLLRHPRVMKELQDEVRRIASGKKRINEEDFNKMHYLKAVLKETLRLHPPIPLLVARESTQDVRIKDYDILAGTRVITNAWAIARDSTTWDEPEEFKPERFLNNSIDFKGHDFELIPFGSGRRGCPGMLFAMATIEIALANLVQMFDWSLPVGVRVEDLDMTESTGINVHRQVPLLAFATAY